MYQKTRDKLSRSHTGKIVPKNLREKFSKNAKKRWQEGTLNPDVFKKTKVYQYDLNGNFVKEFLCVKDAYLETGCLMSNIVDVCKGINKQSRGYLWSYYKKEKIEKVSYPKEQPVIALGEKGHRFYGSITKAVREGYSKSAIIKSCNGKQNIHKSIKWRYIEFLLAEPTNKPLKQDYKKHLNIFWRMS